MLTPLLITIIVIICVVLYWISPIDVIPDIVPGVGWVDDLIVGLIGALIIAITWLGASLWYKIEALGIPAGVGLLAIAIILLLLFIRKKK